MPVLLQMPILVNCHEIGWVTGSTRDLMSPSSSAMMELVKKADVFNDPKICSLWKKGKLKNIIIFYHELWAQSSLSIFIPKLFSHLQRYFWAKILRDDCALKLAVTCFSIENKPSFMVYFNNRQAKYMYA